MRTIAALLFEPGHSTKMQGSVAIAMPFCQIGIFQLVLSLLFSLVSFISHQHSEIVCAMLLLQCKSERMCNNNSNYSNGKATAWHLLNNDAQFFLRSFVLLKLAYIDLINFVWESKPLQILICEHFSLEFGRLPWSSFLRSN